MNTMNRTMIVTALASAYATAAAVSFALGFMVGPDQARAGDLNAIGGNAPGGDTSGVISIKQAAGYGNQQFNGLTVASAK